MLFFFGRCAEICDSECKTRPVIRWCTSDPHAAAPELNQHLVLFNWGAGGGRNKDSPTQRKKCLGPCVATPQ